MSVAVIGAGWAGLACALELAEAGRPVTLYESARQAGGRARGVAWDGLAIDNGQHLLIGAYRETLRLIDKIGAAHHLRGVPMRLETPPDFRLAAPALPAPLHLAVALGGARGLSWSDKFLAARMMRRLRTDGYRLAADISVAELLARHGQSERLVGLLWEPLCLAALNTPLSSASARIFCHVLRDSLGGPRRASEFLFTDCNLDDLFVKPALDHLRARHVDIRLGQRVRNIVHTTAGFELDRHAYGQVVCATHPAQVAALLPDSPCLVETRRQLAGLRWQPICTLWLRYPQPPALAFPMLGLCDGPGQWVFDRRDLRPGLVAVVISATGPHLAMDDPDLIESVDRQLRAIVPDLPEPLVCRRITEKRATFSCTSALDRPGNATPLPGLFLAGDYTASIDPDQQYPATLESAVRSGVQCAHLIVQA